MSQANKKRRRNGCFFPGAAAPVYQTFPGTAFPACLGESAPERRFKRIGVFLLCFPFDASRLTFADLLWAMMSSSDMFNVFRFPSMLYV